MESHKIFSDKEFLTHAGPEFKNLISLGRPIVLHKNGRVAQEITVGNNSGKHEKRYLFRKSGGNAKLHVFQDSRKLLKHYRNEIRDAYKQDVQDGVTRKDGSYLSRYELVRNYALLFLFLLLIGYIGQHHYRNDLPFHYTQFETVVLGVCIFTVMSLLFGDHLKAGIRYYNGFRPTDND